MIVSYGCKKWKMLIIMRFLKDQIKNAQGILV